MTTHNKSGMKDEVKRRFLPPRDPVMIDFVGLPLASPDGVAR